MPQFNENLFVNGTVGIGTASPHHSLGIYYTGGPQWTTHLWGGAIEISNASAIAWTTNAAGQRRGIGETNGGLYFFRTISDPGDTTSPPIYDMVITDAGDVGIGTATPAAKLEVAGNVRVTGDIFLTNADCAEDFEVSGVVDGDPGTVMVIDKEGALRRSEVAYDRKVAGVVSGAGDYKPALILGKQESPGIRVPIALVGKVYCKVDAQYSPIEIGDLLTTSFTPGHAMKASDPLKAFGAVIGKALRPLTVGNGLIPILIALQ